MSAVVMSGGGAGGSIQLGMLDALNQRNINFDHYYGVSTGALNAAGMAYIGLEGIRDVWFGLKKNTDIFKFNWLGGPIYGDSLYKADPLRRILEQVIQGQPQKNATVAAVDLASGELVYSHAGDQTFLEHVLASASVPLHVPPVYGMVDGGVRDVTPLKKAILDGHEDITVLLARPWPAGAGMGELPKSKWFRGFKLALGAVNMLADEVFDADIELCRLKNQIPGFKKVNIKIYAPATRTIATNEFDPAKIRENYQYGIEAVEKGPDVDE